MRSKFTKTNPKIFIRVGGGVPGAPVLDLPLTPKTGPSATLGYTRFLIHRDITSLSHLGGRIQLMLHLRITFDNFADVFLICFNSIFDIWYLKSTVTTLSKSSILLQIWFSGTIFTRTFQYGLRVPFWNQKLHFRFTSFYLLALLKGHFMTICLSYKNIKF